jgi:DNA-binding protein HU-beta
LSLTVRRDISSLPIRMNKSGLIDEVQKILSNGTSKAAAERATAAVLTALKRGLRRDKEVSLVGFGTFAFAVRPARNGFNPHTKRPMKIGAIKTIRFKAGAELRGLI